MAEAATDFLPELQKHAKELGFSKPAIAHITPNWAAGKFLHTFLAKGHHGDMDWLHREAHRRQHPNDLWPEARSAVVVGLNYGPDHNPMSSLEHTDCGNISVYARGGDYHDLLKKKLKKLAGWLHLETGEDVKVFVDTAPLMEKPLAMLAGLGWQGKHTNLVSRELGSWMFLGVILCAANLPANPPEKDHCGSCQACMDICPTKAFIAPYQLDARACISYLTIEHKGHIARKYRVSIGNRIYGCDDCLAVCPWNKYAKIAGESKLHARPELVLPLLQDLAALDDASFRQVFAGSPIKRTGRDRFVRNVMIAIGNSGDENLLPTAKNALTDISPLVRAMAVWALSQLLSASAFAELAKTYAPKEDDPDVSLEWQLA
ncbi:Epoxyqueuosine reductase [hydrothermal vent metagenome]|uniref:Epoxyqueuosine reductase n=1 Tax=hydrothermal vent metagenome TaxID=652676 RepID=A0A3B0SN52_9ZZZZ